MLWLGLEECKVTWEKKEDVPPRVIEEFERGNNTVVIDSTAAKMGQTMHTFVIGQKHPQTPSCHSRPVTEGNTG